MEVNGLPLHVLLVHFVVVLVPLTAIAALLVPIWPAARRRLGIVVPLLALFDLVLVPIVTQAGEWLLARVPSTPLIQAHAALGRTLLPWVIALFASAQLLCLAILGEYIGRMFMQAKGRPLAIVREVVVQPAGRSR